MKLVFADPNNSGKEIVLENWADVLSVESRQAPKY